MNVTRCIGALLLLATLGSAHAQTAKTREQVRNELIEATRNGDVIAGGESGLTLRELNPQRYPRPTTIAGKTREQVKAELEDAIRTGDIIASGESGLKMNEVHPQWYAKSANGNAVHAAS